MNIEGLRTEPIKSKMRHTGLYRYFDGDLLIGKGCLTCKIPQEITNYHRSKDKIDGTVSNCKECLSVKRSKSYSEKYEKSGAQIDGWLEDVPKDAELEGLQIVLARRYRGWQGARYYYEDGLLAGKICPACKKAKIVGRFSKNAGHSDGLSNYCKECNGSLNREYLTIRSEDDPDYYKRRSKEAYTKYFLRTDEEIMRSRFNLHPSGTKICRVCREELTFEQYDVGRGRSDGLAPDCKTCKKTQRKRICKEYWNTRGIPLKCYLSSCDESFEEIDHVVPTSLDGPDELYNLLPMCATHNRKKHGTLLPLWLLDNHPEDYVSTITAVIHFGVDPWGSYVPPQV